MKKFIQAIRATIVGGALFLTPIIVLTLILGKALKLLRKFLAPVSQHIPIESFMGLETPKLLAIVVLVFICFLAGLFARTSMAKSMVRWLETTLLSNLPGYSFMKNLGEEYAGSTPTHSYQSVLVRFDDACQIGFLVEHIPDGRVVVFIPGSPSPWTGSVFIFNEDRITLLDEATNSAVKCLQRLGAGTGTLINGAH